MRHFRLAAAAALAAAVSLTALVVIAPAASAAPLSTKSVILQKLAEVIPGGSHSVSRAVVDAETNRAYVVDLDNKALVVYDIASSSLVPIKTITAGLTAPTSVTVNTSTHEVFVLQFTTRNVVVIDGMPGSPSEYGALATVATGLPNPSQIEVDSATNTVYVADTGATGVFILNRGSGITKTVEANLGQKLLAVDPISHVAYVAAKGGTTMTTIAADLTTTVTELPFKQYGIAAYNSDVLITSASGVGRYNPATWDRLAISGPTLTLDTTLQIDHERGLVYVAYTSSAETTVQVLRVTDLARDGDLSFSAPINYFTFDQRSNRILTSRSGFVAGYVTMYSVSDRPKPTVERIGGADRFAVSAAISAKTYAAGSPVAYIASGAVFTDALSASAAAGAEGGGVLLVQKNAIPPVIATELARLKPQQIIVLGGTDTIDPSVEAALKAYSTTVRRVGGADRYAVSAAVSAGAFGPNRPVAYIASGAVFPDALSGSAGAGRQGGPVLLVEKDRIPAAVQTELTRLAPAKIVVLGGTNTISDSVVTGLGATAPTTRIGGADRFAVSAGISANAFPTETPIAYVASGANFPDALSGGAAAIANGAPVLLVNSDTLPATIDAELDRLLPTRVIILGGTNSVSDAVATAVANH